MDESEQEKHLKNLSDPAIIERLKTNQLHRLARARKNVIDFFEYVMVEEHTRRSIKLAPHQRVGLDFIVSHDRSVNLWPVGHSKTWVAAGLTLFLLGQDPTRRGAIVSATQQQAQKVLAMVRDYLTTSPQLHAVFDGSDGVGGGYALRPSKRTGDPWTQTAITVDRPVGIRDPSLIAVGMDGALAGSRLNWIIIDDILTMENTGTKEQRDKVYEWVDSTVLSRLDPRGAKVIITNTAWHPDDLPHRLWKPERGQEPWPTMRMDVEDYIEVSCPPIRVTGGMMVADPWGTDDGGIGKELRVVHPDPHPNGEHCAMMRLSAHDHMADDQRTLWPERFNADWMESERRAKLPHRFNQLYRNLCRADDTAKCKVEWIEACKKKARDMGCFGLVGRYEGANPTFTGVDLAVSPGEEHDDTSFFTFEIQPGGLRVILDVETGQWSGPEILEKLFMKQRLYNSVVRVESNAAQDYLRQFALQKDVSLPIKPHMTGRAKAHPEHGVEGFFLEIYNQAWLIPNDRAGRVDPQVQKLLDACLYYQPSKHTADVLMACYFAREMAKEWGLLANGPSEGTREGSIGMSILSR